MQVQVWPGPALPLHCVECFAELPALAQNASAGSGHLMLNASIVSGTSMWYVWATWALGFF
jgi:hypothetical protein